MQHAEEAAQQRAQSRPSAAPLPAERREAFADLGQQLPALWPTPVLSRTQKKALRRCLLEQVVLHRVGRDQVPLRLVWRGGEVTRADLPITGGSLAELSSGPELERRVRALHAAGKPEEEMAAELTAAGFRSPLRQEVLGSTVKGLRLKQRRFIPRHQSHPRHVAGALTIPPMAQRLGLSVHWLHDRIKHGRSQRQKDSTPGLSLFPDHPRTIELLTQLRAGHRQHVGFGQE